MGSHTLVVIKHIVHNSKTYPSVLQALPPAINSMSIPPPSLTLTVELLPPSKFYPSILLTSSLLEERLCHCPLIPTQSDSHLSVPSSSSLRLSHKTTRPYSCKDSIE